MSLEETAEYLLSEVPAHQLKKAAISNTPYDATSWNGVIGVAPSKNAIRDKIETLSTDIDGKQDRSEKNEPDGYCGLNENSVVPVAQLGQVLENHSIKYRKFENYEPISVSVASWFGLDLDKIDDRCGHFAITGFDGDYAVITSISNDEWGFEHGDTIVVQNRMVTPVILRRINVADHGYALEFAWEFEEMVVPAGCAFIARFDRNNGWFYVTPLWTPIEDRYSAAPATIHAENYHEYHGRTIYVQGGDDVTIDNVPHGFNATFIQLGAGDVEFLITDPYLTLQNRQGHTKIAGEFGVVGVKVERNNDYLLLFGDTKA